MINELDDFEIEIPEISEVAHVVEDLEDGMNRFSNFFGIDEWQVYRYDPPGLTETTLYGEPQTHSFDLALINVGGLLVELLEPREGESLLDEHLEKHGEGIHHIAYFPADDPESMIRAFESAGMPVVQSGVYEGTSYWFFDTRDELGVLFETAANVDAQPGPHLIYDVNSEESYRDQL